jgi:hypothetical protein
MTDENYNSSGRFRQERVLSPWSALVDIVGAAQQDEPQIKEDVKMPRSALRYSAAVLSRRCRMFSGKYEHRTITGGIGHNLPQEAPQAFAEVIVAVAES